jgi:P-type conjugative transfer protein TrbJ
MALFLAYGTRRKGNGASVACRARGQKFEYGGISVIKKTTATAMAILVLMISMPHIAYAGGGMSGGALETTQLINKAELLKQTEEQVQQTATQMNQYMNMLQNTLQLPENIWKDAMGVFSKLQNLMKTAQSLSMSVAFDAEKFNIQFPGFREEEIEDFVKIHKDNSEMIKEQSRGILEANSLAVKDIEDDQSVIERLNEASKTSDGQMKALQAGNQIAVFGVQLLEKMRSDTLRLIEVETAARQDKQQEKDDEIKAMEQAVGTWREPSPPATHNFQWSKAE